jgi:uncharacterized protein
MSLTDQIRGDLKDAMRAKDETRTTALRLLLASLQDEEGVKRQRALDAAVKAAGRELREIPAEELPPKEPLTDAEQLQVIAREIKKRQDSVDAYAKAGREDLVAPEKQAIEIIRTYLPAQMAPEEARARVAEIIEEVSGGARLGPADMKRVMPVVMQRLRDQADGRTLNQLVRELLSA